MSLIQKLRSYIVLPIAATTLLYSCSSPEPKGFTIYDGVRRAMVRLDEYPKEVEQSRRLLKQIQELERKYQIRIKFLEDSIKEDERIRDGVKKLLEGKVEEGNKNGN